MSSAILWNSSPPQFGHIGGGFSSFSILGKWGGRGRRFGWFFSFVWSDLLAPLASIIWLQFFSSSSSILSSKSAISWSSFSDDLPNLLALNKVSWFFRDFILSYKLLTSADKSVIIWCNNSVSIGKLLRSRSIF